MEGGRLKYGFLANHGILVERVEPMGLLPFLVAEGVLTFEDSERIKHEVTSADKVDKLLTVVHRKGVTKEEVYERLMKVLKEAGDSGGQCLSDVIQRVEKESHQEGIEKRFEYAVGILDESHNALLKAYKHVIVRTLNVDDVLPQLIGSGVVTLEEKMAIRSEGTTNDKASKLVEIVRHRGSAAFDLFVMKLLESEGYRELGNLLSGGGVEVERLEGELKICPSTFVLSCYISFKCTMYILLYIQNVVGCVRIVRVAIMHLHVALFPIHAQLTSLSVRSLCNQKTARFCERGYLHVHLNTKEFISRHTAWCRIQRCKKEWR